METVKQQTIVHRAVTTRPAAAPQTMQRKAAGLVAPVIQASLRVSSPADPAEREAETTAKKVMRIAIPESSIGYVPTGSGGGVFRALPERAREKEELERRGKGQREIGRAWVSPHAARFAGAVQRKAEGRPDTSANVAAEIQAAKASGNPLPVGVRRFMEPRFRADFSNVRVHTGEKSAALNRQLGARAFAVENQLFFGKDQFRPEGAEGKELIAHELTHTIQQGSSVQRSESVTVGQTAPVQVQRDVIDEALDFFADKANLIPGFRMFTIVIGINPVNMSRVDASAANILRAAVEFMPLGGLITKALDNYGIFEKAGAFAEQQIKGLGLAGSAIVAAVKAFAKSLGLEDAFRLGTVWERAKLIFTEPIDRLITTVKGLVTGILALIKDAILRPLADLASKSRGWDLVKALLGRDPITGDPVPQTADALIGGLLKLAGQEEIWKRIQEGKAIAKVMAWFQKSKAELMGFVGQIPALFLQALRSLGIADVLLPPLAFAKIVGVFGDFAAKFATWGASAAWDLLEIVFDVVKPGAIGYIKKTGAALKGILKNPLPFVGNLVKAAKLGFTNFAGNFLGHLKAGLIDWLTGSLPGVYIPKAFTLAEMVKFVFSVLGISWANIRQKLVKVVGEPVMAGLEKAFGLVVTLVNEGPAAAWAQIKEQLNNLQEMVVGGITDLVVDAVVKKAVPKLVAMFVPAAGFVSAIISIYDTVMVFVQKISKIVAVVTAFIDSIVAIAGGAIGAAAARVESILAGLLSLAINFLAGFAGLGKVADKVMGVIAKVRGTVDKAIDWLINFIVTTAKKLFAKLFGKKDKDKDEKPASPEIIGKVKADLEGRNKDLKSAAEFKAMIGQVADSQPGLKSIRVRGEGEGRWIVEASASPFTFVGVVNEFVKTDYGQVVASVAFDNSVYGPPVKNQKGEHAEDKIIGLVDTRLQLLRSTAKPLPQKVEVFVSQSPCKTKCQPNLGALKGRYPEVKTWVVFYKTIYQGTSGTQTKDSMEAIDLLKQDGFHVFQWNEALAMEKAGKPLP